MMSNKYSNALMILALTIRYLGIITCVIAGISCMFYEMFLTGFLIIILGSFACYVSSIPLCAFAEVAKNVATMTKLMKNENKRRRREMKGE